MALLTEPQALKATQRGAVQFIKDALGKLVAPKSSVLGVAANLHAPTTNTAAVLTFAASGSAAHVLGGVAFSYTATPTGGNLIIADGSTTIFNVDVAVADVRSIQFNPPLRGTKNTALVVTLAAGGSGISGKVNALGKTTETA